MGAELQPSEHLFLRFQSVFF